MDWLLFLAIFAVLYRAGETRLTLNQCAWLSGIHSLAYMLTSLRIGLIISRRNARLILVYSASFSIAAVFLCLTADLFAVMLAGMALLGISAAFFFNSFQAFMRGESPPGHLMTTIGLYTVSWSLGCAMGLVSAGALFRIGSRSLAVLTLIIGLAIITIVGKHKRRPLEIISSEEHVEEGPPGSRPVNARYVRVGWLIIFTAMFVQRPIFTFFPSIAANNGISPFVACLPLFLNNTVQALAGLGMAKCRRMLYRRLPFVITHVLAASLFFAVWMHPSLTVCFAAFSLLGVYFGFAYFCSVYYSSNSGNRALNVGINEFLVGTAAVAGLFISEWWMSVTANPAGLYAVCGLALLVSVIIQFLTAGAEKKQG